MRHPYEKFIRIELISIISAAFIGMIALVQGYLILIFISFYLISLSLVCEAMIEWSTHHKTQAGKQFIRALVITFITTYLIFRL